MLLDVLLHYPLCDSNFDFYLQDFAIEGVLGLCWGLAFPLFDIIRGTAIDYMHCICEGVINQLLKPWFDKEKRKGVHSLFPDMGHISTELISVKPPSELTRQPRRLEDKSYWKGDLTGYIMISLWLVSLVLESQRYYLMTWPSSSSALITLIIRKSFSIIG